MVTLEIKPLPFGVRPEAPEPDNRLLEVVGEEGIRKMIAEHYNLLVESKIKDMFPPKGIGLELAKKRSADFFIQRLGGPDYFNKTRGKPMLASRHVHFTITPEARLEWLRCYRDVLQALDVEEELIVSFWNYLHEFSNWMVNTESSSN